MERTPAYDPSMTPSAATGARTTTAAAPATTTTAGALPASQTMVYVCGDCHRDNELKSTDVIRCKLNDSCR